MSTNRKFAVLVQNYFCKYLINQKHVSEQTVKCYRDSFCLLFQFAEKEIGKISSKLTLSDLNADLIVKFLDYLESKRKNSIISRNIRLAAIRSFLKYVAHQELAALPDIERVLAIPMKRYDHKLIGFLTKKEMDAILNAIKTDTWSGQRDQAMLTTLYNTGARVSEILNAKRNDIEFNNHAAITLHGKGRKERTVPLWKSTSTLLQSWLKEIDANPETPLFPNYFGKQMTRSGVEDRIQIAAQSACQTCKSLSNKRVSPHVIRHTTAMHLLQSGIDISVIALWLGHKNINTTHKYMESDLEMKKKLLNKMEDPMQKLKKRKLPDNLMKFLEGL